MSSRMVNLLVRIVPITIALWVVKGGWFVMVDTFSVSTPLSRHCYQPSPCSSSSTSLLSSLFSSSSSSLSSSSSSSWDSYTTIGQDISTLSTSNTTHQIWEMASRFWIPTDDFLPMPWKTQTVHHEKRQRWASQFLMKLSNLHLLVDDDDEDDHAEESKEWMAGVHLPSLTRVLQAAAAMTITITTTTITTTVDRVDKEGIWILDSLTGIHALMGRWTPFPPFQEVDSARILLVEAIQLLMDRASVLQYPQLDQACRAYWAIQGLCARVDGVRVPSTIVFEERVQALPFEIIPRGVDWSQPLPIRQPNDDDDNDDDNRYDHDQYRHHQNVKDVCQTLIHAIPFQKDVIVTRFGETVPERRGTAWIAQDGIGALAYSGKLMPPQPIPTLVDHVMRTVEGRLDLPRGFFDCALCNHYADSEAACKFHTDPEHGTMWDRTTVVVAAGSDRIFAFKPILTTWKDWDVMDRDETMLESSAVLGGSSGSGGGGDKAAATIHLFSGDLVVMRDNCNDDFYHAVYSGISDDHRVSLVLKRAIGRGHGLAGQGKRRRSQRGRASPPPPPLPTRTRVTNRKRSAADSGRRKKETRTSR